MKTTLITRFCKVLIMVALPFFANGQDIFQGKWELDKDVFKKEVKAADLEVLRKLPEHRRELVINEMNSRTFYFYDDGVFLAKWIFRGEPQIVQGEWSAGDGQLSIITEGKVNTYKIQVSTKEKLVLVPTSRKGFFQRLVFIKPE